MKGLRKRNKTTWEGRIYNSKKKPSYKSFYFSEDEYSQKEIEDLWSDMRRAYKAREFDPWEDEVVYSDSQLPSVEKVCEEFLELSEKKHAKRTTGQYRTLFKQIQCAVGSKTPIEDVKVGQLDTLVNSFDKKYTRKIKASCTNQLMEFAFRNGYIARPLEVSVRGGVGRSRKEHVTLEELNQITNTIRTRFKRDFPIIDIVRAIFFLGFRISELYAFRPRWISDDLKYITYGDSDYQPKGRDIDTLDTNPILDEYKDELASLIQGRKPNERVFDSYGRAYLTQKFTKVMTNISPDKHLTPHSFRKSFAMYLIEERNLDPKSLHEMMRHSSFATTMEYYTSKEKEKLDEKVNPKQRKNSVGDSSLKDGTSGKSLSDNNLRLINFSK